MPTDVAKLYHDLREAVPRSPLSEVLSMLLMLAKDLKKRDLEQWAQLEMSGYIRTNPAMTEKTIVPEYRAVSGLWHNDHGQPLVIQDAKVARTINDYRLRNSVAELEEMSRANTIHSALDQSFPPLIKKHLQVEVTHYQFHSREVAGVLAEIRSRVIDWLDKSGPSIPEQTEIATPPLGNVVSTGATVFYSWQSDLPNRTNRGFIEDCLERAIKELKADGELRVDARIDRDTKNMPGSPDIAAAIFEKIESCSLFVCDVSIINKEALGRPTPNPNVLIELGFAVKALGWNRIVCILNQSTGTIEDLPFDLRHRRVRPYRLDEDGEKADPRKLLTGLLKSDIEATFSFIESGGTAQIGVTGERSAPRVEILDATLECQPPVLAAAKGHIHQPRPKYVEGKLVWTVSATIFIDSRPGAPLTVPLHRCKSWLNDRYTGTRIPLSEVNFQSVSQSHVSVDESVLLIRGPGKVSFQGTCETPFREIVPDSVKIDIRLPISELDEAAMEFTLDLAEAHQGGGWPLRWRHRPSDE